MADLTVSIHKNKPQWILLAVCAAFIIWAVLDPPLLGYLIGALMTLLGGGAFSDQ